VAWARPGYARGWCGRPSHRLDLSFRLHIASDLKTSGEGSTFSQIEFRCGATTKNLDSELETPFWHPAGTGIWRRSSPSSSPTSLHQPSMIPHPCVSNSHCRPKGMARIGCDHSCNCYEIVRAWCLVSIVSAYDIVATCCA
jgi:hypothetical protein